MILDLLDDPVDVYAAKVSCRRFFYTCRSFADIRQSLDNWQKWELMTRLENVAAERLLCILCRDRHNRSEFPPIIIGKSGLVRSCLRKAVIECGRSRLSLPVLRDAVTKIITHGDRAYSDFVDGINSFTKELVSFCPPHYIHSPFHYEGRYGLQQVITILEGSVTLCSTWDIRRYLNRTLSFRDACQMSDEAAISELSRDLTEGLMEGGIWLCPHIDLRGKYFCRAALEILREVAFGDSAVKTKQLQCDHCKAHLRLEAEEDGWDDECEMTVKVEKSLGPVEEVLKHGNPLLNKYLRPHLSGRISFP